MPRRRTAPGTVRRERAAERSMTPEEGGREALETELCANLQSREVFLTGLWGDAKM